MQKTKSSYRKLSLLVAIFVMLSAVSPSIAQCSMMMDDCDMNESDCCTLATPIPMDCHDTDSEETASDECCANCECGYESAEKPLKVTESVISVNEIATISEHHIRHIYLSSGLNQNPIPNLPDFTSPPIYLLVATFLI